MYKPIKLHVRGIDHRQMGVDGHPHACASVVGPGSNCGTSVSLARYSLQLASKLRASWYTVTHCHLLHGEYTNTLCPGLLMCMAALTYASTNEMIKCNVLPYIHTSWLSHTGGARTHVPSSSRTGQEAKECTSKQGLVWSDSYYTVTDSLYVCSNS